MLGILKSSIPAALSFKLIGAALNLWPLRKTESGGICLYEQAAIFCIDESNELLLQVKDGVHHSPTSSSNAFNTSNVDSDFPKLL
jgi:hypothetical protein